MTTAVLVNDVVKGFIARATIVGPPPPPPPPTPPRGGGGAVQAISGLTFAVKDNFDVKALPTVFGSPAWRDSHAGDEELSSSSPPPPLPAVATRSSPVVDALLAAGAVCLGKSHCSELTFDLFGANVFFGTPVNPKAPQRMPGGSSSGSAALVAAGIVDFALGSDTGGSMRAPASFCGVFGIRPSHGVVTMANARPLAPSFDTCGWFTRSSDLLLRVGTVLFNDRGATTTDAVAKAPPFRRVHLYYVKEAFDLAGAETTATLKTALERHFSSLSSSPSPSKTTAISTSIGEVSLDGADLLGWADDFRVVQGGEVEIQHGEWARKHEAGLSPPVAKRFKIAAGLSREEIARAKRRREEHSALLRRKLEPQRDKDDGDNGEDVVFVLPTVHDVAPLTTASEEEKEVFRRKSFALLCLAGLAGLPQISIPIATGGAEGERAPLGVSFLSRRHSDLSLLHLVNTLFGNLPSSPAVIK